MSGRPNPDEREALSSTDAAADAEAAKRRVIDLLEVSRRGLAASAPPVAPRAEKGPLPAERNDTLHACLSRLHGALQNVEAQVREESPCRETAAHHLASIREDLGRQADAARSLELELRQALAQGEYLQNELCLLEQKALRAIADAGRLHRRIDELETAAAERDDDAPLLLDERRAMEQALQEAREERRQLTHALMDSEAEIARFVRAFDALARSVEVA